MQEMQEMQVWSLSWEDPLEEDMATHSSILDWEITTEQAPIAAQCLGDNKLISWHFTWRLSAVSGQMWSLFSKHLSNYFSMPGMEA